MERTGVTGRDRGLASRLLPWLVGLAIFCVGFFLDANRRADAVRERQTEARVTSQLLATTLSAWLRDRAAIVAHLARAHGNVDPARPEFFVNEAAAVIESIRGFQAINWIDPAGVIRIVVPEEANRAALGRNLLDHPLAHVRQAALSALQDGRPARTRTIALYQGGQGIATYWPFAGAAGGAINGVFRIDDIMRAAFPSDGIGARYHMQLVDEDRRTVFANTDWDGQDPLAFEASVEFMNQPLYLRAASRMPAGQGSVLAARAYTMVSAVVGVACGLLLHLFLRRQEQLAAQGRRIALIMDSTVEGLIGLDLDGRVVFGNRAGANQLGYREPAVLTGRRILDEHLRDSESTPTGANEPAQRVLRAVRAGKTFRTRDAMLARVDGTCLPIEVVATPVADDGVVSGAVLTFVDLTEQRAMEKEHDSLRRQFQHAQKMESLGILAGGIAHDFNNILVAILGNASLALQELEPGTRAHALVTAMETASERAAELTRQLLAYSGRGRFELAALDMGSLVGDMSELLTSATPATGKVHIECDAHLPAVFGDATQLRQLVMNLITNAIDAIGERPDGRVDVRVGPVELDASVAHQHVFGRRLPAGRYVGLRVEDNGAGMAEATVERIFDPFFTTKASGRGLGLSAVLGIVQGHGGMLCVDSEVGRGTVFMLLLPCSSQEVMVEATTPAMPPAKAIGGTALLVDDEPMVRNFTEAALSALGMDVLTAEDGEAAVSIFQESHDSLSLVLIDQSMTGISGTQAVQRMREIDGRVPAVLMSGFDQEEVAASLSQIGFDGFLQKPFRYADLRVLLERVLEP